MIGCMEGSISGAHQLKTEKQAAVILEVTVVTALNYVFPHAFPMLLIPMASFFAACIQHRDSFSAAGLQHRNSLNTCIGKNLDSVELLEH